MDAGQKDSRGWKGDIVRENQRWEGDELAPVGPIPSLGSDPWAGSGAVGSLRRHSETVALKAWVEDQ